MRALISKDLDRTRKYAARVSMKYTCSRIFIQCDDEHVDVAVAVAVEVVVDVDDVVAVSKTHTQHSPEARCCC